MLEVGAEADGLAVDEGDQLIGTGVLGGDLLEGPVVEDVAVLVDLDEGRPPVVVGAAEGLLHVLAVHVVGPGHEGGLGPEGQADRVERRLERPEGCRLGHLALLGGGRVLALGQPVDLVVEEEDGDVDVPAQRVDEVVAADGEGVAVTGDDPDVEVGTGHGQPGGHGRGPAVDGVEPVGVHVIGKAGRAADPGEEDGVLPARPRARA